ncbi:MAG: putative sulfate exporter family transporter [Actinomycetota bacterium]|nr:putative sulfate exporter family transporter [Actinomycetota bacterium]
MIESTKLRIKSDSKIARIVPGFLLTVGIVVLATLPLHFFPLIGLAAMSILTGALVAPFISKTNTFTKGIDFSSKYMLQLSVVLSGFSINFSQITSTAKSSFLAILTSISVALIVGYLLARWWGLERKVASLISVGTAICGASAIAAVSDPLDADDDQRKIATSTIFTFNLAALFIFPVLGHLMHLSQSQFGVMAGGAVNDLSSVVATSHIYGHVAESTAIVVKLTRSLAIIPIVLAISIYESLHRNESNGESIWKVLLRTIPKFIVLFIAATILGNITSHLGANVTSAISTYTMEIALAGIGLSVAKVRGAKISMILFGASLWAVVTIATVANIKL